MIVLWASAPDADASRAQAPRHPATQAFDALVDAATVDVRRYETLE